MPKPSFGANAPPLPDAGRRAFLGSLATTALVTTAGAGVLDGGSLATSATTDPIFAAIAAYREAAADFHAADIRGQAAEQRHGALSAEERAAEVETDRAYNRRQDALEAVIRLAPTTVEGLAAWSAFLSTHLEHVSLMGEVPEDLVRDLLASVAGFAIAARGAQKHAEVAR